MIEAALEALLIILDPSRMMFLVLGVAIGLVIGILPGLNGMVGMSIALPFVFGMDPYTGMALLIGMISIIHTSDTFPSVLLGVPGTSASQATIMDGYPLAKQGEASRALSAAFFCSMIGGIIGAVALFLSIPVMRPLVLLFGSPELFMLALLGLSTVGILAGNNPLRGIAAGILGLLLGSIGSAPAVPEYRYVFDILYLSNGIPLSVLALSLFALPEMVDLLSGKQSISSTQGIAGSWLQGVKDSLKNKWLVFRSSVLGTVIGFIPGLGGSVVDWMAWGFAKNTIKDNYFGKGDIRGVIAVESATNSKEGGSLIPTLMFGIPGGGTTAILLGGLTLMGLQAGPRMVTTDLSVTMSIVWTLVIANILGTAACMLLAKPVSRLTLIPANKLVPFLMILLVIGAYQSTRHWGDIIVFIGLGVVAWFMKHLDWPRAPLLIGFVLATPVERYLWISISRYEYTWLTNPGVIIIGIIIVAILASGIIIERKQKANRGDDEEEGEPMYL